MEHVMIPIQLEQIRKVNKGSDFFKVSELNNASTYINGEWEETPMFLVQGKVPRNHFFIIDKPIVSRLNGETFFIVYMITHSPQWNNILIQKEWIRDFHLDEESHVTTDTFIVREVDIIMGEEYGTFDLETYKVYLNLNY